MSLAGLQAKSLSLMGGAVLTNSFFLNMQKSVTEYLDITADKFPSKVAVEDENGSITFAELRANALKIAEYCVENGIFKQPVCVYLPKSKEAVTSFEGVNYSGNFYVPLDVKSPDIRIQSILTTLQPVLIITDEGHKEQADGFGLKTTTFEKLIQRKDADMNVVERARSKQIDTDPTYSIFTSGSTGNPKGVVISHRGVIDYIDWAIDTFKFTDDAKIGNQAPFYFDNSTLDIYLMLATGATLNIIPESNFIFPAKLVDYLNDNRITFVFWVPFVLVNVANFNIFASKKPEYLKDVFFAGEVMPNKHLNYWRKYLPQCRYANLYGPTEITVDCTFYIIEREFADNDPLPIGFPCKNSDVLILNNDKKECSVNEEGELCVRGSSLALGYYNNPEKTAAAFIQNPLNKAYPETIYCTGDIVYKNELGEIMYIGRKDFQIKHSGYRIELGEIENAVLSTHMVDSCCVVYDFANKQIVLFYQSQKELNMGEFRKSILKFIPRYMMPTENHREEKINITANGKIDRNYYMNLVNGKN